MVHKSYTVIDEAGLHARPASLLCQLAMTHDGDVNIVYKGKTSTLKSIMIIMSLGIPYGAKFEIEVDGENKLEMLDKLTDLLKEHKIID